jgi:hypothetical protein
MENDQRKSLRIQGIILLVSLIVQYALGMYVNLFVEFPQNAAAGQLWEFSWRQPSLATHIIVGILLLFGSLVFFIRVVRRPSPAWKKPALLGLIGIVLAGLGGSTFIPTQSNAYSYLMSLAFLISFFGYTWGLQRDIQQKQELE